MKRWMLILAFTACSMTPKCAKATEKEAHFHLSPGETVLIDTEQYFTQPYTNLHLKGEVDKLATVYRESSVEEVLSSSLESDEWYFGPSVGEVFTIVHSSRLEVWALQVSLTLIQSFRGNITGVEAVDETSIRGFVFWTPEGVFYINLLSPALEARPISGVPEASRIVVCAKRQRLLAIQSAQGREVFSFYSLDYGALQASLVATSSNFPTSGTLVDALCVTSFYLLFPTAYYRGDIEFLRVVKVPSRIGRAKGLKYLSCIEGMLVVGEKGAAIILDKANNAPVLYVFPGATQGVDFHSMFLYLSEHKLVGAAYPYNARMVLRNTTMTDLLSLSRFVLGKAGREVVVLRAYIVPFRLSLTGGNSPYRLELCADGAVCVTVSVTPVLASRTAIVPLRSHTVAVDAVLSERSTRLEVDLRQWFAGPNMQAEAVFPAVPLHTSVGSSGGTAAVTSLEFSIVLPDAGFSLLCALTAKGLYVFVGSQRILVYSQSELTYNLSTSFAVSYCAADGPLLYVCGQDEGGEWWLQTFDYKSETSLERLPAACKFLLAENDLLVLILEDEVKYKAVGGTWVKVVGGSQWTGVQLRDGELMVYSQRSVLLFSIHMRMSLGVAETVEPFSRLLYATERLAVLNSTQLTVYYVVSPFCLVRAFELVIDCSVQSAVLVDTSVYIHCGTYIQAISLTGRQQNAAFLRIPVSEPVADSQLLAGFDGFAEVRCSEVYCQSTFMSITQSAVLSLDVELAEGFAVSGSVTLFGELRVRNPDHNSTATLAVTLVNEGAAATAVPFPPAVEVTESLFIDQYELFRGHNLLLAVTPGTSGVEVVPSLQEVASFSDSRLRFAISPGLDVYISANSSELSITFRKCQKESCSRYVTQSVLLKSLKLFSISRVNFLCKVETKVYLLCECSTKFADTPIIDVIAIITFDLSSNRFEVAYATGETSRPTPFHIITETTCKYHVFFYSTNLEHCRITSAAVECASVDVEEGVLALSSEALSGSWRLYAVTAGFLVQYQLTSTLQFLSARRVSFCPPQVELVAVGDRVVVLLSREAQVYSLPTLQRIRTVALPDGCRFSDSWRGSEQDNHYLLVKRKHQVLVLDLSAPEGCEVTASLTLIQAKFIGPREIAGIYMNSCVVIRLVRGGIVVQVGAARAFEVSAAGTLNTVSRTLQVRTASWPMWTLLPVSLAVLLCVLCRARRKPLRVREVEMQGTPITL